MLSAIENLTARLPYKAIYTLIVKMKVAKLNYIKWRFKLYGPPIPHKNTRR